MYPLTPPRQAKSDHCEPAELRAEKAVDAVDAVCRVDRGLAPPPLLQPIAEGVAALASESA
jgi:hypothetical protein